MTFGKSGTALNVSGNGDSVSLTGQGNILDVSAGTVNVGASTTANIQGAGDTVIGGTGDRVTVTGNSDALTLGTGGTASITGTGETVNASSDTLTFGKGDGEV